MIQGLVSVSSKQLTAQGIEASPQVGALCFPPLDAGFFTIS